MDVVGDKRDRLAGGGRRKSCLRWNSFWHKSSPTPHTYHVSSISAPQTKLIRNINTASIHSSPWFLILTSSLSFRLVISILKSFHFYCLHFPHSIIIHHSFTFTSLERSWNHKHWLLHHHRLLFLFYLPCLFPGNQQPELSISLQTNQYHSIRKKPVIYGQQQALYHSIRNQSFIVSSKRCIKCFIRIWHSVWNKLILIKSIIAFYALQIQLTIVVFH